MLISLKEARDRIDWTKFRPPPTLVVDVAEAPLRISAGKIRAAFDVPAHDASAMDGFAVRAGDEKPREAYEIREPSNARLRPGEAVRISTGTPVPHGVNAVVRVESASVLGGKLFPVFPPGKGQDIQRRGESMRRGATILDKGEPIHPYHLGALLSQGIQRVRVHDIHVGILPVGDEILPSGSGSGAGVRDTIGPMVGSLLTFSRNEILTPAKDDPSALKRSLLAASPHFDAIITLGGASVGESDHLRTVLAKIGQVAFEGVRVNILKRGTVACIAHRPVIVLPGQPISAITVLHEHGLHVFGRLVGRELRRYEKATLAQNVEAHHRMDTTMLFSLCEGTATPLPWGVARGHALLRANAFGILERGRPHRAGDRIVVQRLWGTF